MGPSDFGEVKRTKRNWLWGVSQESRRQQVRESPWKSLEAKANWGFSHSNPTPQTAATTTLITCAVLTPSTHCPASTTQRFLAGIHSHPGSAPEMGPCWPSQAPSPTTDIPLMLFQYWKYSLYDRFTPLVLIQILCQAYLRYHLTKARLQYYFYQNITPDHSV